MSEELKAIAAQIGDRTYPIKVEPRHQELVLLNLQTINQKLAEFKKLYGGKDMQDYLAMTILWYANQPEPEPTASTEQEDLAQTSSAEQEDLAKELQLLEQLLDAEINKR
jgi:cell division protein ZapA